MVNSPGHILTVLALVLLVALVYATGLVTGAPVESVVTESFFDGIKSKSDSGCEGRGFYTREAFLNAVQTYYPGFAQGGSEDDGKREISAFFAHVTHETGSMCHINEIDGSKNNYRKQDNKEWPCQLGKAYFGRGPLQLSWNYNYGPAGQDIGFDGLGNPDKVAQDPVIAFKAALWFWRNYVRPVMSNGFGATTRAINSNECSGGDTNKMNARVRYYTQYCRQLGVDPGSSLTC